MSWATADHFSAATIHPSISSAMPVPADPAFAERAARLSCFGSGGGFRIPEPGNLSTVPMRACRGGGLRNPPADQELVSAVAESSGSGPIPGGASNARKRKGKGKSMDTSPTHSTKVEEKESSSPKGNRPPMVNTDDCSSVMKGKESDAKLPHTSKEDYIHVRARRGQATDRHSLAERVRREKISERMKLLQDLVPGCNKIIGKAVMLDEIINYVQSLQRQVEFLSMKLATLNPYIESSIENMLQKDMRDACGPPTSSVHMLDGSAAGFPFSHQPQLGVHFQYNEPNHVKSQSSVNQLPFALPHGTFTMQVGSFDGLGDASTHHGNFLENDLQNCVQMGFSPPKTFTVI